MYPRRQGRFVNRLYLALIVLFTLKLALAVETAVKPATSAVAPAVKVPPVKPTSVPPIPALPKIPIDARLVEKSFQETQYAFLIFNLIKNELVTRRFTEAKTNEYAAKIYWEIMNEYAVVFTKKNMTAKNLNCVISAYTLPDGVNLKKLSAPNAYLAEFKDTVLKEKKWAVSASAPTKIQVEQALFLVNTRQQITANIITILTENKVPKDKAQLVYDRIVTMFQNILSQNGSTKESFLIFLNQLKKNECSDYFKILSNYTNERGLKLITDKIPKQQ